MWEFIKNTVSSFWFKYALIGIFCSGSLQSKAATVLIYHHVSNTMPASTSISPERFIAHMDYLEKNNYHIVPLLELTEKLRKGEALADKTIAITFDDSYGDVYTSAYPILKKRGWPFTFFVNTKAVGSGKLFVTWDQLREMSKTRSLLPTTPLSTVIWCVWKKMKPRQSGIGALRRK